MKRAMDERPTWPQRTDSTQSAQPSGYIGCIGYIGYESTAHATHADRIRLTQQPDQTREPEPARRQGSQ